MAIQDFVTGQVLTSTEMDNLQTNDYNQTVSAKTASYVLVAADKGTRITMSNAGATTITVNTSLFTAGDTLFITNIGAGACTITAGTATVSTASSLVLAQYDSGRLYFTSTGVAIWEKYQGAAAGGGGKVLQVVTVQYSTSTTIATTTFTDTGLSATITPTLNTSKILVLISQSGQSSRSGARCWGGWQYLRGATVLASSGIVFGIDVTGGTATEYAAILSACYLDSPATTSATTYKTQAKAYESTSSGQVAMNGFASTITLMEIGA